VIWAGPLCGNRQEYLTGSCLIGTLVGELKATPPTVVLNLMSDLKK
jgi:hypothetical protein